MADKLKTAEVLAFERKLSNSDGLMYAGVWSDIEKNEKQAAWRPIHIEEKAVRGTISNRLKASIQNDPAKLDAEVQKANLQRVDVAALPHDYDTLRLSFTLRVLGNLASPCACNNPEYQKALSDKVNAYISEHQFLELAKRYAENIANGRFLWRNRIGVDEIKVKVSVESEEGNKVLMFDAEHFGLREFSSAPSKELAELASVIQQGLLSDSYTFLKIDAFARIGKGQEVFPSQELVLDRSSNSKGKKSKFLYKVHNNEQEIAAMHSQKIGNALRTIDTWYPNAYELGPIAVEPYGSVTNRGVAYRQPKEKTDFYNLLDAWVLKDKKLEVEEQHYVIACLVRGGVFGASDKEG